STVDVVEQHPAVKATKALQPAIDRAATSLERATELIRQILNFARERNTEQETVDLAPCLASLERILRWICRRDIRIEMRVAANTPPVVCNRCSLENAILNLALNARDAMPEGGVLSITAAPCRKPGNANGVSLRVSDTGRGMSSGTMARAFDPFFTTKT